LQTEQNAPKERTPVGTKTFEVNTANFENDVLKSNTPVLVDFWAEWCGPCRMIAPIVDQLANEYEGKLKVGKLDADQNQDLLMRYNVMGIPALILFKGGQPVLHLTGYKPKDVIVKQITPYMS
jgi:thioredoxin 1